MKLGTVVVAGLAALCVVTAVTLPEKKETIDLSADWNTLEVYKIKMMYSEAIDTYKNIIDKSPAEDKYKLYIELRDYCKENEEQGEYINACRMAVSLNPSDYESAFAVLDSLNAKKEAYDYIHTLMKTPDVTEEAAAKYSDYYDAMKGLFSLRNLKVAEITEWYSDSYAIGVFDEENDCVIAADGTYIAEAVYGKIDSYSPEQMYIAADDKNQKVYINLSSRRKYVPYDGSSKSLVYYSYLGRFESGLANYCDSNGKWGYLTTSMSEKYNGFDAATPLTGGLFAAKKDGKWNVVYHSSTGDIGAYSADEIYLENNEFVNFYFDSSDKNYRNYIFYAKNAADAGWSAMKLAVDFSGKETTVTCEKLGSSVFEDVRIFGNGIGTVKHEGKWKFIKPGGELQDIIGDFSDVRYYNCGMCPVMNSDGKWGFIDAKGKVIIEPQFEEAHSLCSSGTACVRLSDGWKLLRLTEYK